MKTAFAFLCLGLSLVGRSDASVGRAVVRSVARRAASRAVNRTAVRIPRAITRQESRRILKLDALSHRAPASPWHGHSLSSDTPQLAAPPARSNAVCPPTAT